MQMGALLLAARPWQNDTESWLSAMVPLFVILLVVLIGILASRSARKESREFALAGINASITVVSVDGMSAKDNELRATCELEIAPTVGVIDYRVANASIRVSAYRLSNVTVYAPLVWIRRFQSGLVLRGRVHPKDPKRLRLNLEDGHGEGRTYGGTITVKMDGS